MADVPKKRQCGRYWGEPVDCLSSMQIAKYNHIYREHLNEQYKNKKEENLFIFDKDSKNSPSKPGPNAPKQEEKKPASSLSLPIKDVKEYEFLKKQRKLFYKEDQQESRDSLNQLNSIIRNVKFQLGDISPEDFYA